MRINRTFFYQYIRSTLFKGGLKQSQIDGINRFLDYWDARPDLEDVRYLAYILATVHHETDQKFQPIEEYGRGRGLLYGLPDPQTRQIYYGRGYVQLTWKRNYEFFTALLGKDLVNHPELALDPIISAEIIFRGMLNGSFTGKKLKDYFNAEREDWLNARRIINGTDKAANIANYARDFYASLNMIPEGVGV